MISSMIHSGAYPNVSKKPKLPDFEKSLEEISHIILQMEQGEPTLEQSLQHFEKGVALIKHAQKILQSAEQKVQILMQPNNTLEDYENPDK